MEEVLIVTPHPDDETLGCGGTILKYIEEGHNVHWLIVTTAGDLASEAWKVNREVEIQKVTSLYNFKSVYQLEFEATKLDQMAVGDLVKSFSDLFENVQPTIVFSPYLGDIHSDHKVVFESTMACTKWFRYPSVKKVFVYETLSETDFTINPDANGFRPNVFVNISKYLEKKINIMNVYKSEVADFPFPRSDKAIRSLAYLRGAASGYEAAEAFMLLKERVD